jgi:hypothetical protein
MSQINVSELKANNLAKAKSILATKGLTFVNVGISDKIKINTLVVDYTPDLKTKVEDIIKNIGISERAAIALLLETEIAKIKIDTTIQAVEKTISDAKETIGKSHIEKVIEAAKASAPKVDVVAETPKAKVVKLDETLKQKINETTKDILSTKGLIYPQIVISDIAIKFGEFFELTGILAVAEAKAKAKQLMEKTGITSERVCLVYMYEKEITFVPVVRTTEKTFSINFDPSSLTIVLGEQSRFDFHQKAEYTAVTKVMMALQTVLGKISKMPNPMEKLKDLAEYLNNAKVKTFKECITQTENFLKK